MSDPQRATLEELLEFANKVREAGGGNPLDALMPAVPDNPSECLIAKNLNFNCQVRTFVGDDHILHDWTMVLEDRDLRDRIAKALDLEPVDGAFSVWDYDLKREIIKPRYAVVLPREISLVAEEFDSWSFALEWDDDDQVSLQKDNPEAETRLREFAPYIAESVKEVMEIGIFNDKGELIL